MPVSFVEKGRPLAVRATNYGLIAFIVLGVMSAAMGIAYPGIDLDAISFDQGLSQILVAGP